MSTSPPPSPWTVTTHPLNPPPLSSLVPILIPALLKNFNHASVSIATPPDLRLPPFSLAAPGLSWSPSIADVGGPPNLTPTPKFDRIYSLLELAQLMKLPFERGLLIGAAAGPFTELGGRNSELAPNLAYEAGKVTRNNTHCIHIDPATDQLRCGKLDTAHAGLMANLYGCAGEPGPTLHITASARTGPLNFTATLTSALRAHFGADTPVSLGGVFVLRRGKTRMHVMPDFSRAPLETEEDVNGWLKWFDMDAPMTCLTVVHSADPGLGLRMEHTHCFGGEGVGGHYHFDLEGEEVEYEAWLGVAEKIVRVDRVEREKKE